jgi:hypothetical protein
LEDHQPWGFGWFWPVMLGQATHHKSSQADRITLGSQTHRCHPPWGTVVVHLWGSECHGLHGTPRPLWVDPKKPSWSLDLFRSLNDLCSLN